MESQKKLEEDFEVQRERDNKKLELIKMFGKVKDREKFVRCCYEHLDEELDTIFKICYID